MDSECVRLARQLADYSVKLGDRDTTDAELLRRYAADRDEAAFVVLLRRHASLVWSVCRRATVDLHEAEDAFQATFLVLAAKAKAIRRPELLHNWLYGVAARIARRARLRQLRRPLTGQEQIMVTAAPPVATSDSDDLRSVLDEELNRLPDKYRAPILLCCVEGQTQDVAAARLGWTHGSIKGRLERGREVLRSRLARRGVALSAATILAELPKASARVPEELLVATTRAAGEFAAGRTAELGVAWVLAKEALRPSRWAVVVTTLVVVAGAAGVGVATLAATNTAPAPLAAPVPVANDKKEPPRPSNEVLKAWKAAGARFAWCGTQPGKPELAAIVDEKDWAKVDQPIAMFDFSKEKSQQAIDWAKLPPPEVPFVLDLFSTATTDDHLKDLKRFESLTRLSLIDTRVTDKGMANLTGFPRLTGVDVFSTAVTAAGMRELRPLKELREFRVADNGLHELGDAELRAAGQFPKLQSLSVSGREMTDAGVKEIAGLSSLRVLRLRGSNKPPGADGIHRYQPPALTDAALRNIGTLKELRVLGLSTSGASDAGFKELAGLKQLTRLDLNYTLLTDAGLKELGGLTNLTHLSLAETKVTDAGLAVIKGFKSLTSLQLPRGVTDAGLKEIREALPECKVTRYDDIDP